VELLCGSTTIIPNEAKNEAGHTIIDDPWTPASYWK